MTQDELQRGLDAAGDALEALAELVGRLSDLVRQWDRKGTPPPPLDQYSPEQITAAVVWQTAAAQLSLTMSQAEPALSKARAQLGQVVSR